MAARGSKFWQENWERHIDMLEDYVESALYKTVWVGPAGISWSITAINFRLSVCFILFWVFGETWLFASQRWNSLSFCGGLSNINWNILISCAAIVGTIVACGWLLSAGSNLSGEFVKSNGLSGGELKPGGRPRIFGRARTEGMWVKRQAPWS